MKASNLSYRPDIDGLRAIAVLSVILFHINESLVPGGFVGVDIFFVISGYLITLHILKDIENNSFSIVEFYKRRVKRIVPAMLVVVAVVVIISQFIMRPIDAEKVAESGFWSLLSLANVYFWIFEDTGYFAAASNEKPLLHLWSLGVEEQFYFIWPLILLMCTRCISNKYLLILFFSIASGSFLFGEYIYDIAPSFAYYMLPTRAGELLVGAILAGMTRNTQLMLTPKMLLSVSSTGVILLFGSLIFITEHSRFPGLNALFPTLGAAALIFSGFYVGSIPNAILSLKPIVWIGKISYSAYLWHWPLLAFYRYGWGEVSLIGGLAVFVITIVLAWLSYRFIETPTRKLTLSTSGTFLKILIAPSIVIALVIFVSMKLDGYGLRWFDKEYKEKLVAVGEEVKPANQFDYVCQSSTLTQKDITNPRCILGQDTVREPKVILFGDSNAAHYVGLIGVFSQEAGFSFRNLQLSSCPPVNADISEYTRPKRLESCLAAQQTAFEVLKAYDIIIISANWTSYHLRSKKFLQDFFKTVEFQINDGKKVILIGKAPIFTAYDRLCREKAISFPFVKCEVSSIPYGGEVFYVNEQLKSFSSRVLGVEYYDAISNLCPNNVCSLYDELGRTKYYDPSHLSLPASWRLGENIIKAENSVPFPFNKIREWLQIIEHD